MHLELESLQQQKFEVIRELETWARQHIDAALNGAEAHYPKASPSKEIAEQIIRERGALLVLTRMGAEDLQEFGSVDQFAGLDQLEDMELDFDPSRFMQMRLDGGKAQMVLVEPTALESLGHILKVRKEMREHVPTFIEKVLQRWRSLKMKLGFQPHIEETESIELGEDD